MTHQQPAGQPLFQPVQHVAHGRLPDLDVKLVVVPQHPLLEGAAAGELMQLFDAPLLADVLLLRFTPPDIRRWKEAYANPGLP